MTSSSNESSESNNRIIQQEDAEARLVEFSPLPISGGADEIKRARRLLAKIEKQIGKMIVDNVKDPSTDYTEDTAVLAVRVLGHHFPGSHRALNKLGIPPSDALILTALGRREIYN